MHTYIHTINFDPTYPTISQVLPDPPLPAPSFVSSFLFIAHWVQFVPFIYSRVWSRPWSVVNLPGTTPLKTDFPFLRSHERAIVFWLWLGLLNPSALYARMLVWLQEPQGPMSAVALSCVADMLCTGPAQPLALTFSPYLLLWMPLGEGIWYSCPMFGWIVHRHFVLYTLISCELLL